MDPPSSSSLVEAFTKNNDAPSDPAIKEINDILREPLQDLRNLDAEILSLEQCLAGLKTRRTDVQQRVAPYQSVLSPIRCLPTDMLGEIFYHCLPTHRNPIIKTNESPLLLTQICGRWRTVAIAHSRLWSRLYITFSDDGLMPVGVADGQTESGMTVLSERSKERVVHLLCTRIDAVKEWISRSGSTPLSISFRFTCKQSRPKPHPDPDPTNDMTLELFQFLASISPRFQDLDLNMSLEMYRILENMIPISTMKMLDKTIEKPPFCEKPPRLFRNPDSISGRNAEFRLRLKLRFQV